MMQNQQANEPYNGPAWSIVSVADTTMFNRDEGIVPAKRVTFKLYNNQKSFVDVRLDDFNAENVASAIDEAAGHLFDVLQLRGAIINVFQGTPSQA